MVNLPTGLNSLRSKADNLDVCNPETVTVDFKKISDAVNKELVKKAVYNKLKKR